MKPSNSKNHEMNSLLVMSPLLLLLACPLLVSAMSLRPGLGCHLLASSGKDDETIVTLRLRLSLPTALRHSTPGAASLAMIEAGHLGRSASSVASLAVTGGLTASNFAGRSLTLAQSCATASLSTSQTAMASVGDKLGQVGERVASLGEEWQRRGLTMCARLVGAWRQQCERVKVQIWREDGDSTVSAPALPFQKQGATTPPRPNDGQLPKGWHSAADPASGVARTDPLPSRHHAPQPPPRAHAPTHPMHTQPHLAHFVLFDLPPRPSCPCPHPQPIPYPALRIPFPRPPLTSPALPFSPLGRPALLLA